MHLELYVDVRGVIGGGGVRVTEGLGGHDLNGDHGGRADGVVGVGLGARVHAALEGIAGRAEGGLGGSVHLFLEAEDDHVADVGLDLGSSEHKTGITTDADGVGGGGCRLGSGSCGGLGGALGHCLGHDDLLVNRGGLGRLASGMGPDDDDLRRALTGGAVYEIACATTQLLARDNLVAGLLHAQVAVPLARGVDVADSLSERHGGDG